MPKFKSLFEEKHLFELGSTKARVVRNAPLAGVWEETIIEKRQKQSKEIIGWLIRKAIDSVPVSKTMSILRSGQFFAWPIHIRVAYWSFFHILVLIFPCTKLFLVT